MGYQEYSKIPAWEQAVYKDGLPINTKAVPVWAGRNGMVPPPVGEKILVSMNGLGEAVVEGYFVQEGFLGLLVKLDNPPDWYLKQNKGNVVGHVFGTEIKPLPQGPTVAKQGYSQADVNDAADAIEAFGDDALETFAKGGDK